jgi:hypothetical protein
MVDERDCEADGLRFVRLMRSWMKGVRPRFMLGTYCR